MSRQEADARPPASSLPIESLRSEFEAALETSEILVVHAPTGSGKSTQLPRWCMRKGRTLVVEPRRVACQALATWVAQLEDTPLGRRVGYQVRFDKKRSADTELLFVTPGMGLNLLDSGEGLDHWDYLVLDEFHERSWALDLLLMLHRRREGRRPKLVLCSATLSGEPLAQALGATLLRSEGRSFPVEISYRGQAAPSLEDLPQRTRQACLEAMRDPEGGDMLVFLPGRREIEGVRHELERPQGGEAELGSAEIVVLHGSLDTRQAMRSLSRVEAGPRRIVLATNIAETALTLPGVRTVIDSGLQKGIVHRGGHSALVVQGIAADAMAQRAGRAGRVAPGKAWRLYGARYEAPGQPPPELARIELEELVLRAASAGVLPAELREAPWLDPPPTFALERACGRLRHAGALDPHGRLTPRGRQMASSGVSMQVAAWLVDAPAELRSVLAALAALVEVGQSLFSPRPFADQIAAREALLEGLQGSAQAELRALYRGEARRHHLHAPRLQRARQLWSSLGGPRSSGGRQTDWPTREILDAIVPHVAGRAPELGFAARPRAARKSKTRGKRARSEPWSNGEIELDVDPDAAAGYGDSAATEPTSSAGVKAGLVLRWFWVGSALSVRARGELIWPCHPSVLARAELGQLELGEVRWEQQGGQLELLAPVARRLGGATLSEELRPLRGAELRQALAELIAHERIGKDRMRSLAPELVQRSEAGKPISLGSALADELFARDLAEQLREGSPGRPESSSPAELARVLAGRLESLGVESCEDLGLLSWGDLVPSYAEIAEELGLEPRAVEELSRDFPRLWSDGAATFRLEVRLDTRRVRLHPYQGKSEPSAAKLPRFRAFRVEYWKASRRLKLR